MTKLELTSPAFSDGGEIPREYGYKHGNKVPPLKIKCAYTRIKRLALIMDDPDAMGAVGKVWVHWVVWNIDWEIADLHGVELEGSILGTSGMTDFGEVGYGGPAPPDKRHTYIFKLYALDTILDLPEGSPKAALESAMEGHIVEQTQLTGTYAP